MQRDSIVSKILRGNKAIHSNKILKEQIKARDSVILTCKEITAITIEDLIQSQTVINNQSLIIQSKDLIITNEVKKGKRERRKSFLKGAGVGAVLILILSIL